MLREVDDQQRLDVVELTHLLQSFHVLRKVVQESVQLRVFEESEWLSSQTSFVLHSQNLLSLLAEQDAPELLLGRFGLVTVG